MDLPRLVTANFTTALDPSFPEQSVAFGTSGHRGSALTTSFSGQHILATREAVCLFRAARRIVGSPFLGVFTYVRSKPTLAITLELLAVNGVHVHLAAGDECAPTPFLRARSWPTTAVAPADSWTHSFSLP
jgi:phosphoglucomutase